MAADAAWSLIPCKQLTDVLQMYMCRYTPSTQEQMFIVRTVCMSESKG
jgi:hypothetical protein